jgi:HK97 gp10 family phage protein
LQHSPVTTGRWALRAAAQPIRARAASLAPRGDPAAPNLHQQIGVSATRRIRGMRLTAQETAGAIGPTLAVVRGKAKAPYGMFVELGTVRIGPRPYLRPAFDVGASGALGDIRRELWTEISKALAKGPAS